MKLSRKQQIVLASLKAYGNVDERELFCCCQNFKRRHVVLPFLYVSYNETIENVLPEYYVVSVCDNKMYFYNALPGHKITGLLGRIDLKRLRFWKNDPADRFAFIVSQADGSNKMLEIITKDWSKIDGIVDVVNQIQAEQKARLETVVNTL